MEVLIVSVALTVLLPVLVLWPIEYFFAGRPDQSLWRSDTVIDILYWIALPTLRAGLTALAALPAILIGFQPESWLAQGFGPLAEQPAWLQVVEFLVIFDLGSYWVHRWFHGRRLWKFHAVHHSSKRLDWLSTLRHHPVNDIAMRLGQALPALLLGFTPQVIAWCLPVLTFHSLLIHANVRWGFGPLGWLIVSPTFHHWHHTAEMDGRDKNFSEISPIWDLLFGTYYWPAGRHPDELGIDDKSFPENFVGQLLYPFRRTQAAAASES